MLNALLAVSLIALFLAVSTLHSAAKRARQNRTLVDGALRVIAANAGESGSTREMVAVLDRWGKMLGYQDYQVVIGALCEANGVLYSRGSDGRISEEAKKHLSDQLCLSYR